MRVPRLTIYQIVLEVLCLALLIAGLTLVAIKYPGLPAKIPNHFDAAGNVTDYTGKGSIWLLEGVNLAMAAAKIWALFRASSFSNTSSLFQGLMVGMPTPPSFAISRADSSIIFGSMFEIVFYKLFQMK